jgi:succinate dehydrogenase / fumarate reductase, membrane anchor subunit
MSLRSPLGKVLGKGSAKEGVGHWWMQRLTSVALIPLTLWFVCSLFALGSLEFETVRQWLAMPWRALAVILMLLTLMYHSQLGVQVVVEDYVHHHGLKLVTLITIKFAHVLAAAIGVFAVLKVAFGSAA